MSLKSWISISESGEAWKITPAINLALTPSIRSTIQWNVTLFPPLAVVRASLNMELGFVVLSTPRMEV